MSAATVIVFAAAVPVRMNVVGANVGSPQTMALPPLVMLTLRLVAVLLNPLSPPGIWIDPAPVPNARVMLVEAVRSRPPLSERLLVVGRLTPSSACRTPPVMLVAPEY